jgi:hypothetical protein
MTKGDKVEHKCNTDLKTKKGAKQMWMHNISAEKAQLYKCSQNNFKLKISNIKKNKSDMKNSHEGLHQGKHAKCKRQELI